MLEPSTMPEAADLPRQIETPGAAPQRKSAREAVSRTAAQIIVYDVLRVLARIAVVLLFRMRCKGRKNIPADGPVLVCANHQSSLDPPLIGLAFDRRLNYLARKSLFSNPVFRRIIEFLDAIPIDRDGTGLGGLKETLRRLKRGELVLLFPEGSRTRDGQMSPLKPGFIAVARRSRAPLLPAAIDGAFDVLPPDTWLPRPATVHVVIGRPITADEADALDDDALLAELERRLRDCHARAQNGRRGGGKR
jgi:1-acyl-sn-glycerol-3-phosphate acyltransferase